MVKHSKKKMSKEVSKLFNNAAIPTKTIDPPKWEDLDKLFSEIGISIIETVHQVNNAIEYVNNFVQYKRSNEFKLTIHGIKNDIEEFTKRIKETQSIHAGKTGEVIPEDQNHYMSIYIIYQDTFDKFRVVLLPNIATLTEYMSEAAVQYKEQMSIEENTSEEIKKEEGENNV